MDTTILQCGDSLCTTSSRVVRCFFHEEGCFGVFVNEVGIKVMSNLFFNFLVLVNHVESPSILKYTFWWIKQALQFVEELGKALHSVSSPRNASHHLELVYVIPPQRSQNLAAHDFGPQDLQQLSDAVDGFSLMTYDFSGPQNPGPNAPLPWIQSSLQMLLGGDTGGGVHNLARMIFVGINFYGNDFALSEGMQSLPHA